MKTNKKLRSMRTYLIILLALNCIVILPVSAQSEWIPPDSVNSHVSLVQFDTELANDGRVLYNRSCNSCHGDPGLANYAILVPSPGDPVDTKFQEQSDGSLFYKIAYGREVMPGFLNVFGDDEIWSLVAYIRSFNEDYIQPVPDLTGIVIPKLEIQVDFDENIDKLVVKVSDDGKIAADVQVQAFIRGLFGNFSLGLVQTNEAGLAFFHVDDQMPGDIDGDAQVLVRAKQGYGTAKSSLSINMLKPSSPTSPIDGRHLWASGKKAPIWIFVVFLGAVVGIWSTLIYIVFGLFRLRRLKSS